MQSDTSNQLLDNADGASPSLGKRETWCRRWCCRRRRPRVTQICDPKDEADACSFYSANSKSCSEAGGLHIDVDNNGVADPLQMLSSEDRKCLDDAWSLCFTGKQDDAWMAIQNYLAGVNETVKQAIQDDPRFARLAYQRSLLQRMDECVQVSEDFNQEQLSEAGYMDCSTPGKAKCFVACDGTTSPGSTTTTVILGLDSADSPVDADIPRGLMYRVPRSVSSGLDGLLLSPLTFTAEVGLWPEWLPLVNESNIIKDFGNMENITHLKAGAWGLRVDYILYSFFRSCLDADPPFVEGVIASPPAEATTFLGVSIPAKIPGSIRVSKPFTRFRVYPRSWTESRWVSIGQDISPLPAPLWIVKKIWTFVGARIALRGVAGFQQFLNSSESMTPQMEAIVMGQQTHLRQIFLQMQQMFGVAPYDLDVGAQCEV